MMNYMVSEKSLEMNVNENLVNSIRQFGGSFASAFIYGFTLREEARHGFDSSINLPGTTKFLFSLQYKKPVSVNGGSKYRFEINNNKERDQHISLWMYSHPYGNIWYAFPLLIYTSELSRQSPYFLDRTCFVNVRDFPSRTLDRNVHIVEIDSQTYTAYVFSNEKTSLKIYVGEEFIKKIKDEVKPVAINEIKDKEKTLSLEDIYEEMRKFGISEEVIRHVKEGKFKHRFTSGFFTDVHNSETSY
jgi:hypothetical protein